MLNNDYRDILLALSNRKAKFFLVGAYAMAVHGYRPVDNARSLCVNFHVKTQKSLINDTHGNQFYDKSHKPQFTVGYGILINQDEYQ